MKSINIKIKQKGIKRQMVAKMVGIDNATLSRIISKKQSYVSADLIIRINTYLDALNTDDVNIFKNMSK